MAKFKTRKTIKKRFRVTRTGKIIHKRGSISHRTSKERSAAKARRKREQLLKGSEKRRMKRLLNTG